MVFQDHFLPEAPAEVTRGQGGEVGGLPGYDSSAGRIATSTRNGVFEAVKLGVVFPQNEIGIDPVVIREFATGVERAGFDYLLAYDHVLGHRPPDADRWRQVGPYTETHAFHEVFVLFSYLAALTSKLEFVTEVLVLPQRQTALVAKQAAELHLLSSGRLRLGIGVGWNPEEYRALGSSFHDRGRRMTEQVQLLRLLWENDVTTLHGEFHTIESSGINPRPLGATIPVWMGGQAPAAIKRAAAIADGFMLNQSLAAGPATIRALKEQLAALNRDPAAFGLAARVQLGAEGLGACLAACRSWQDLGVTHLAVNTMYEGVTEPRRHLELACSFIEGVAAT